jgi:hypothetical protein
MFNKYIFRLVGVAAIVMGLGLVYHWIYTRGYSAANLECDQKFQAYESKLNNQLNVLEADLQTINLDLVQKQSDLVVDVQAILQRVKSKPTIIVKEGRCTLQPEFVDSINEAIQRVNQE